MNRLHDRTVRAAILLWIVLLATCLNALQGCSRWETRPAEPLYHVQSDVVVPMRDGVRLRANLYLPSGSGPFPTLIFRTPYSKDEGDPDNESTFRAAAFRGYAVLVQDVRGRYRSEGVYTPYRNEGKDGYDTIEWAASQPWSTGQVGTFGLSYPGAVQWLAAVENPPHLRAMVPAMCFSTLRQFIYFGGVFELDWIRWAYSSMSPDVRIRKGLPGPRTYDAAKDELNRLGVEATQGVLPLLDLTLLRDTCPWYYEWLSNPPYTAYWDFGELSGKYPQVKAAVLNLSGWYDEPYGPQGAVDNFNGLLSTRASWPDPKTMLLIGPWIHGVDAVKSRSAGERTFGPSGAMDYDSLVLDWMDFHLKGIDNRFGRWPKVRLYQMGTEEWIDAAAWPLPGTVPTTLYLAPPAGSNAAGSLSPAAPPPAKRSYLADPSDPVRDDEGTNFGAYNLRALADRRDVLTFETAPLTEDIAVLGPIRAEMNVSADVKDFDLFVKLLDVAPDGTAFNLMSPGVEVQRLSYRQRTGGRIPVTPGEVVHLTIDTLKTGNTFVKGHRLRVSLCSSWYPIYARNLQTGAAENDSAAIQPGMITVHLGGESASRIILPVVSLPGGIRGPPVAGSN